MAVSFIGGENHRPVASHRQTLSHNVASSTTWWEWPFKRGTNALYFYININNFALDSMNELSQGSAVISLSFV